MNTNIYCPVCGAEKKAVSISEYDCDNCGFDNAFVNFFASQRGRDLWLEQLNTAKLVWKNKKRADFATADTFVIGSNIIAYRDKIQNIIYVIHGNGTVQTEKDAIAISSNERNYGVVYLDGSVKVFGDDNSFGQKDTDSWTEIRNILMGPNCTYGITSEDKVIYAGVPLSKLISDWEHIVKLCCGTDYIVGLHANGSVSVAGEAPDKISSATKTWNNVVDIKISRDCVLGLQKNGKVLFAGNADNPKGNATKWDNIISISADNMFVYGLSSDGNVVVAGFCKPLLDKGRSSAVGWENITSLSSNQSCVSAIAEDGSLMFAGSISGDKEKMLLNWDNMIKPVLSFR